MTLHFQFFSTIMLLIILFFVHANSFVSIHLSPHYVNNLSNFIHGLNHWVMLPGMVNTYRSAPTLTHRKTSITAQIESSHFTLLLSPYRRSYFVPTNSQSRIKIKGVVKNCKCKANRDILGGKATKKREVKPQREASRDWVTMSNKLSSSMLWHLVESHRVVKLRLQLHLLSVRQLGIRYWNINYI